MSSHREAPEISKDPVADSTDLYAFVSPDKSGTVTLIANYIPLEEPAGGPNFYEFGDDLLYNIHIDNTGDGEPDITYQFHFETGADGPWQLPVQHRADHLADRHDLEQQADVLGRAGGPPRRARAGPPPALPAVQHRPAVDAELRDRARPAGGALAGGRDQGLRRAARRGVLRRPGLDLRPGQPAAVPVGQRVRARAGAGQHARRQHHQPPERALHRDPGADVGPDRQGPADDRGVDQRQPPRRLGARRRQRGRRGQRPVAAGLPAGQPAVQRGAGAAGQEGLLEPPAAGARQAVRRLRGPPRAGRPAAGHLPGHPAGLGAVREPGRAGQVGQAARRPGGHPADRHPAGHRARVHQLHRVRPRPTCCG